MKLVEKLRAALIALGVVSGIGGCYPEPDPPKPTIDSSVGDGGEGNQGSSPVGPVNPAPQRPADSCWWPRASELLPARPPVMQAPAPMTVVSTRPVPVSDLFERFKTICGGCHVDTALGGFQVTAGTLSQVADQRVLDVIRSDDPTNYMPPAGTPSSKKWSERSQSDPVREFAGLFEAWLAQGRPVDLFSVQEQSVSDANASAYRVSPEAGQHITNMGTCIPLRTIVATETSNSVELDEKFAAMEKTDDNPLGLPETLAETDLVTFDSRVLAEYGVVSFVPGYPLWSDGSAKMRHVRVPRGESIQFDKEKQEFKIPANTRFYKTFLKKVIDETGKESYRKIETRLIVSRPDRALPDGSVQIDALFGVYAWNEDESEAVLVRDPLRNGLPFRDRLFTYITDEQKAKQILAANPRNPLYELEIGGAVRRYAIPGSERCIHCHMGSRSESFSLGFTPLQLVRRPKGEGGVIEETGADEFSQLQRLIDYGIVTGIASPSEVVPLEDSQGERKPRTPEELVAQGYMFGNCSHCHNPRGFPSVRSPELRELLDFYPHRDGGIFEFPLDRMSPRIKRGPSSTEPMPYITPSLRELPVPGDRDGTAWTRKSFSFPPRDGFPIGFSHIDAPWRSVIYRNVDTPFTYTDDYAIFPHMPMDTAGFDCRAPRILGEWMVSIPSKRKHPEIEENAILNLPDEFKSSLRTWNAESDKDVDLEPQPYVEVKPGEEKFDLAVYEAKKRLDKYKNGERYAYCPDTTDVVDPKILREGGTPRDDALVAPENPSEVLYPPDGVPDRAHWIVTDFSDPGGEWNPRRLDWPRVMALREFGATEPKPVQDVIALLTEIKISQQFRTFALSQRPFGMFKQKEGCDFSDVPKASSFTGAKRPRWFDYAEPEPAAPVFETSAGAAVFNMICVNCHGPRADSGGRQAETIMMLTGGDTRVANLRDGLFGPPQMPGQNREREFVAEMQRDQERFDDVKQALAGATPEEWAARYLLFMGLGGTLRQIPPSILSVVGNTEVVGAQRAAFNATARSANMLSVAVELCHLIAPVLDNGSPVDFDIKAGAIAHESKNTLIPANGDAELWEELCSFENPAPVRGLYTSAWFNGTEPERFNIPQESVYKRSSYPPGTPVNGPGPKKFPSLTDENQGPFCVLLPPVESGEPRTRAEAWLAERDLAGCPDGLVAYTAPEIDSWALRGAMNAGLAVFLYLDAIAKGTKPALRYDQCELLNAEEE